jgi:hypothetical protein
MKSAKDIEKLVGKINVTPGRGMDQKTLGDILPAQEETTKNFSADRGPNLWRIIMGSRITKFAVAAVLIIAAIIIIKQFGGSIDGASTAWADVLGQISNAGTVTYKKTIETEKHTFTSNIMQMEPGLMRMELTAGPIIIWDFSSGITLQLTPEAKSALITHRIGRKYPIGNHNRFEWLKRLHEQDTRFVGEEDVDGLMVNVYVCEVPFERTTAWVDPETNLPVKVRIENFPNTELSNSADPVTMPRMSLSARDFGAKLETFTNEDGETITRGGTSRSITISSGRGSGKGIQEKMTVTYHDFDWGVELDKSLFSMVPPDDYSVKERTFDVSDNGENSLVYSLNFWATMSEGTFPDAINDLGDPEKVKSRMIAKFDKDGDPEEELDAAMAEVHKVLKGLYFAQEKKVDGGWGYAGRSVKLGQADAMICWWFDEETGGYRAVFGDLRIEDVAEDQLPVKP